MPSGDSPSPSSEDLAAASALVSMSSEELCDLRSRDFNGTVMSKKDVDVVNRVALSDRRAEDEGSQTSQGSELNRFRSSIPDYNRAHCFVGPTMTMRKPIVQSGGNIWPVGHARYHQLQPVGPHRWSQSYVQKQQLHLEAENRIWHEISNLLTPRIILAASQALLHNSQRPGSPVCPEPGMFTSKVVGPAPSMTLASTAIGNLW
jgi:hypothetical protein